MLNRLFILGKKLKLDIKISLVTLAITSSVLTILYWSISFYTKNYILHRLDKELSFYLVKVAERLQAHGDKNELRIKSIINDISLQESLTKGSFINAKTSLNKIISIYPAFNYIFLTNKEKDIITISEIKNKKTNIEDWELILRRTDSFQYFQDRLIQTSLLEDLFPHDKKSNNRELVQLYFSPIKKNKEIIGWIGISYKWQKTAFDLLNKIAIQITNTGQLTTKISILENEKTILASHPRLLMGNADYQASKRLPYQIGNKEFNIEVTIDSFREIQSVQKTSRWVFAFILLIGVSLGLLLYFWLSHFLLKRLDHIHSCVTRIRGGQLEDSIPNMGNDRIGLLARAVNDMQKSLLDFRINLEKKSQDRTKKTQPNHEHLEKANALLVEEQLRLEAAMIRISLATNTGNIGVWELDIASGDLHWDERMFKLYGVSQKDFNNTYDVWEQYVHPEDLDQARVNLQHAIETGTPLDTEFRVLWPNGKVRYIKAQANFLYDEKKKPVLMIGTNYDLTKSKEQEKALVSEKAKVEATLSKIEAIFSATSDVIIAIDSIGTIKSVNQSITVMFGYSMQELLGKNVKTLMPKKYANAHDTYLNNYHKTGKRYIIGNPRILQAQKKDGSCFPIELIVNEAKINSGVLFTGIIRDISEQVKTKENLQQKEALLTSAIQSSSAGFVIENCQGEIIEVNDSICNWLGYKKEELLGSRMVSLLTFDQQPKQLIIVKKIFSGELSRIHEERKYICKDGSSVWGLLSAASVKNENDEVIYLVMHIIDISQEKLLTEKLNTRNKALEKSNEDLDQFAYIASHDLKSPLNAIKQLTEWISEDCHHLLPEESRSHLSLLKTRTKRMEKLLEDLLLYSRAERYNYTGEKINLEELIQSAWDLFAAPETFTLQVNVTKNLLKLPRIPVDIVIRNLISNAIKHHDKDSGLIQVSHNEQSNIHIINVSDDGPGIPPSLHQKALKMFQTLKSRDEVEGSGMGLALVKKIISYTGGSITIESDGKRNTNIKIVWPKH